MTQIYTFLTLVVSCLLAMKGVAALSQPSGCGDDRGCFPIDCSNGDNCKAVVTWADVSDGVMFELMLSASGANNWIALGLSSDTQMRDDSVTDCIQFNGNINVAKSYNAENIRVNDPIGVASAELGITDVQTAYTNGELICRYKQSYTNNNTQIFDLNMDWHLLVAYGVSTGETLKSQHATTAEGAPSASDSKVNLQANEIVGEAKEVLVKVHGALMMFGWMFCASIGIVLARFFKPMYPNSSFCNEKVWFAWHRFFMVTCFLVVVAAFVIIFVDVSGWAHLDGHTKWQKAHPYIGCVVTGFVVLNPIMAVFRPHPDGENRYLFNWLHWFVGTSGHILAAITIVLGVSLGKSSVPFYVVWIVLGWAAYQAVFVLLMEMHECSIVDVASKYHKDGELKSPPGSAMKTGSLVFHILVITAVTAVCIVLLAIN